MSSVYKTFTYSAVVFLVVYLLRGVGILSYIPGGIILTLLLITIVSGLMWAIMATWRY